MNALLDSHPFSHLVFVSVGTQMASLLRKSKRAAIKQLEQAVDEYFTNPCRVEVNVKGLKFAFDLLDKEENSLHKDPYWIVCIADAFTVN